MAIAATLELLTRSAPLTQVGRIRRGVPAGTWAFVASLVGMGKHELAETLKLNPRTLQRRTTLRSEEAERILRVFRVFQEATVMCHGDQHEAQQWINSPAVALGGHRPIEMLDTDIGNAEVLNIIRAVNWGVYL
jgi:putative toxin-antitoxin system antitoxin component (TIGR02293 family)